ncbi:GFA family protein [Sphingomonas astaxanthinifaciens]|uniref:Aldehyde-activating protein n=1 Tax=Sphingomonas astaxanthinifaciens DSM 22298 TaxID=1123267 RepID=A0ABQ5Z662_9SPHN|nr:GFA family protein [Sphingomonas astaxanthinifaciens]GLR48254.1 aldehyde-activating protein [Sphingomonas astaxanthinifaciens DSM 22298]
MTEHRASCRCGQLVAIASGDPVRVSVCHCRNCQKRTGSAFAAQARWPGDRVAISGSSGTFEKAGDSGSTATFHFCPECGSDVYFVNGGSSVHVAVADSIAIPIGAFDDPSFATPQFSVWESRKHEWVEIRGPGIDHD